MADRGLVDLEQRVIACADLVGRTGGREFEIGFLDDAPDSWWYAHAKFKGARISVEAPDPEKAAVALIWRLLDGATCQGCNRRVTFLPEANRCRWWLEDSEWKRSCGPLEDRRGTARLGKPK